MMSPESFRHEGKPFVRPIGKQSALGGKRKHSTTASACTGLRLGQTVYVILMVLGGHDICTLYGVIGHHKE